MTEQRKRLNPKERMAIPRQRGAEAPAQVRAHDFGEVARGLSPEEAMLEASRCLECRKPICTSGCPVGIDIRGFISLMLDEDFPGAIEKIREKNSLPAICGRVCPQETQCEAVCTVGKATQSVAIGMLERFLADYEASHGLFKPPARPATPGPKVAVVGSGPAGLTCAADLAKMGYQVTVFEALHAAGGVLRYGIPEFRLPKDILDAELDKLREAGVEIVTNFLVGQTATIDELMGDGEWGFKAVFLGTGAGTPSFLGIPGENLSGVYSANEFLTRVNLMGAATFPDNDTPVRIGPRVAVIGGGNTAMDAVRTSRRMGAEHAMLVYRRSRQEMPAREEEVRHAEEEGIELMLLTNPTRILDDGKGWVAGLEVQTMELGEPDASGRRRPVPVAGSEHTLPVDVVIEAIGQSPNPIIQATTPGLEVGRWGVVVTDEKQATNRPGVFAGGDLSRGGATVILAMRDGKLAAASIHEYLTTASVPAA